MKQHLVQIEEKLVREPAIHFRREQRRLIRRGD
jgi:hypothetical protein